MGTSCSGLKIRRIAGIHFSRCGTQPADGLSTHRTRAGAFLPRHPPLLYDALERADDECDTAREKRCRFYEALPSVLLVMNDLPTCAERMSAARDGKGARVQVETAGGKWKADTSTRPDVAYDHRRHRMRAGMDFAVGEAGRVGVSAHGLRGSAEMTQGGGERKPMLSRVQCTEPAPAQAGE